MGIAYHSPNMSARAGTRVGTSSSRRGTRPSPGGWLLALGVAWGALLNGCTAGARPVAHPETSDDDAPKSLKVETERVVVTPAEALPMSQLFDRGKAAQSEGKPAEAVAIFDRIVALEPAGAWSEESMYEAAVAREELSDRRAAAQGFEEVARRFPHGDFARQALMRALRLQVHLEEWARAKELADVYSQRYADLGPRELIVVASSRAQFAVAQNDVEAAEYYVGKGRQVVEEYRLDAAGIIPRDLAQLYFALGEVRRLRGEQIRFDPFPPDFGEVFEQRARLLLDAQSAYSDAMRAYDAHWSVMAGYRIAELYQRLHDAVVAMPRPPQAGTERNRALFEAALRMRYSVLLRKGLSMLDHTVAMAERTGEQSEWLDRCRAARAQIEEAARQEQAAVEALPFSRMELAQVLERIQSRQH